jgi:hypothetical protein
LKGNKLLSNSTLEAMRTQGFSEEVVTTMKPPKIFSAVHTAIIVLSLVSSPLAQTPRERLGIQQEPQQADEEKKAAMELERKAMALIDEVGAEAMSLKL